MPAAKYPPAAANFIDSPYPSGSGHQMANFLNIEPNTAPCPSVPGKVQSENSQVDHQQRGQPAFK
eukprot:4170823-Alexandrium_andersonii.AAC.1